MKKNISNLFAHKDICLFRFYQLFLIPFLALYLVMILACFGLYLEFLDHQKESKKTLLNSSLIIESFLENDIKEFNMPIFYKIDDGNTIIENQNLSSIEFDSSNMYKKITLNHHKYLVLNVKKTIQNKTYQITLLKALYSDVFFYFFVIFCMFITILSLLMFFYVKQNIQNELINLIYIIKKIALKNSLEKNDFKSFLKDFKILRKALLKLGVILEKQHKDILKNNKKIRLKYLQSSGIVSALSHEFKNPLSVITGYAEILSNKQKPLNSDQKQYFISKITHHAQRLNQLLNRLNLAIKLENDLLKPQASIFNLKPLIEECIKELSPMYQNKSIKLVLKDKEICADKVLIENAIYNLLQNAFKYSHEKIKISLKNKELKITDDGEGIAQEEIALITKKFYRVSKKYQENSLGLGLFIVKYILKLHHLSLKIKSRPHKGSSFSIKF